MKSTFLFIVIVLILAKLEYAAWQSSLRVGVGVSCLFLGLALLWRFGSTAAKFEASSPQD